MKFPMYFIAATDKVCTLQKFVSAPYFRKSFTAGPKPEKAEMTICGLGFYELYINGVNITKGLLAPYISAPDDLIYYDTYDVTAYLQKGVNVIGVCLGNGMQNCFGGYVWAFDKARWRGAPEMALRLEINYCEGDMFTLESDESFLTSPSPIDFDDLRCGEYYNARKEQAGWNTAGFDDSSWKPAIKAPLPKGEPILCEVEPIVTSQELEPVSITKTDEGYIFDFGANCAGLCRLKVKGMPGQCISTYYGEYLEGGKLARRNLCFDDNDYVQKDIYICKGGEEEVHTPNFTYHGFRYVLVKGITDEQATQSLLTYLVMNSDLEERGGFFCSDAVVNTLQTITRRSQLANFYYIPTDCPQREKNGWTADAALSAEHMLLNLSPEKSYREWLRNIRKAQNEQGALPGIIPTGGWGFHWGNGPAWDSVLVYLPYFTYLYRGDKGILEDNAAAIFRYLHYLTTRVDDRGLLCIGLGDWCPPNRNADAYKSPLELTDTILSMDICEKSAYIFAELGMTLQHDFAMAFYHRLRTAVREKLLDHSTLLMAGNCQTSQAMGLFYGVFEQGEKAQAFTRLLELIEQENGHMDTGVLGGRVIFHVLTDFGKSDLALSMITRSDFPSYGNWVERGATSLWECFQPEGGYVGSLNHHFWGDISSWFIQCLAGTRLNPNRHNICEVNIQPSFVKALSFARGFHIAPSGRIESEWKRDEKGIVLKITVPDIMSGQILLENGYMFEDGSETKPVATGVYHIVENE